MSVLWHPVRQATTYGAKVVQVAHERGSGSVADLVAINSSMQMFSGVRGQVTKLNAEAHKQVRKRSDSILPPTQLPYLRRQRTYEETPLTLAEWLTHVADRGCSDCKGK